MDGECERGGSLELARLIDEYGQHLIPDLKQYYGIDLRDLFSEDDPLDPRWVLIHVANLPIASSFVAMQRGGLEFRGWDEDRYADADMIDALQDIAYILIMANRDPNKTAPPPPKRYRRPGVKSQEELSDDKKTTFKAGSFGDMLQQAKRNKRKRLAAEAARKQEVGA